MLVYLENPTNHTMIITPGAHHPETTDFMENGVPKQMKVQFMLGKADVPDPVGKYLIDRKLAFRVIPASVKRFRQYVQADAG